MSRRHKENIEINSISSIEQQFCEEIHSNIEIETKSFKEDLTDKLIKNVNFSINRGESKRKEIEGVIDNVINTHKNNLQNGIAQIVEKYKGQTFSTPYLDLMNLILVESEIKRRKTSCKGRGRTPVQKFCSEITDNVVVEWIEYAYKEIYKRDIFLIEGSLTKFLSMSYCAFFEVLSIDGIGEKISYFYKVLTKYLKVKSLPVYDTLQKAINAFKTFRPVRSDVLKEVRANNKHKELMNLESKIIKCFNSLNSTRIANLELQ